MDFHNSTTKLNFESKKYFISHRVFLFVCLFFSFALVTSYFLGFLLRYRHSFFFFFNVTQVIQFDNSTSVKLRILTQVIRKYSIFERTMIWDRFKWGAYILLPSRKRLVIMTYKFQALICNEGYHIRRKIRGKLKNIRTDKFE